MRGIEKIENNEVILLSEAPWWEYFPLIIGMREGRYVGQYTMPQTLYPDQEIYISKPTKVNGK